MNSKRMTAKKAIEIANRLGYSLGRNGKKGYYISFFDNGVQIIRWQLAPEMTLSQVVENMQSGAFKSA